MNFDELMRIAQVAVLAASVAVNVYLYVRGADRRQLEQLEKRQADGDAALAGKIGGLQSEHRMAVVREAEMHTRLSVLETKMTHVPTHADLLGIRNEMKDLNEAVAAIGERSETTQEMVHSIHRYLLENGRK